MVKIQFMKLKISNYCCSSQVNNETSIVEWCILDIEEFWSTMAKELKFEKYVNDEKSLKKLQKRLFEYGHVRSMGCDKCRTIYLFQHIKVKLSNCLNYTSSLFGDNSLWLKSDNIKTIEDTVNNLFAKKEKVKANTQVIINL